MGPARLGYGGDGEATVVSYGANTNNKYITTYFRRAFVVAPDVDVTNLTCRLVRDDGAVIWLNGRELYRSNLPGGTITHTTLATIGVGAAEEQAFITNSFAFPALLPGTNLIAAEIHQSTTNSSDLGFMLEVTGSGQVVRLPASAPEAEALFLAGGQLRIAWPATAAGWRLYTTTNVAAPAAAWLPLAATPTLAGGEYSVIIPPAGPARFFRLGKP